MILFIFFWVVSLWIIAAELLNWAIPELLCYSCWIWYYEYVWNRRNGFLFSLKLTDFEKLQAKPIRLNIVRRWVDSYLAYALNSDLLIRLVGQDVAYCKSQIYQLIINEFSAIINTYARLYISIEVVLLIATLLLNLHTLTLVWFVPVFKRFMGLKSCFNILNVKVEVWLLRLNLVLWWLVCILFYSIQKRGLLLFFLFKYRYPWFYYALRWYPICRGRKKRVFEWTLCERTFSRSHVTLSLESTGRGTLIWSLCHRSWHWLLPDWFL